MEERQSAKRGPLPAALASAFVLALVFTCTAVFLVKEGGVSETLIPWIVRGILAVSSFAGGFLAAKGRRRRFLAGLFVGAALFAGTCLAARILLAGEFRLSAAQLPQAVCCLLPGMAGAMIREG